MTGRAEIIDVARAAGVRRVVLLSSLGAGTRPDRYPPFIMFEAAVRESGLDWTILRPGGFASNTLGWAQRVRAERTVAAPFGEVGLPFIDPADIAEVAAAVLRGQDGRRRRQDLRADRARAGLAPAAGRGHRGCAERAGPVRRADPGRGSRAAGPVHAGAGGRRHPGHLRRAHAAEQRVSPDVERVLRRTPATFAAWAARNVAAFR